MLNPSRQPDRRHPWSQVPAEDYEGHMGAEGVNQLRPLSAEFGRVLAELRPASVLILGVATGNGLEHVDAEVTLRVVGLDVNAQFLATALERHRAMGSRLELRCEEVERAEFEPGSFEMIWAGLFFEHVNPGTLIPRIAAWLAPGGSLVVAVQLPAAVGAVSPSSFGTIQALASTMRLVPPGELALILSRAGLSPVSADTVAMAQGKSLQVSRWLRPP